LIECESFELFDVGGDVRLLRVRARARDGVSHAGVVSLVVRSAESERWLTPLALSPTDRVTLNAAFAAPPKLVDGDASYSLQLDDGSDLELPAPRPGRTHDSDEELAELRHRLASAEAQLEETRSLAATMAAEVEEAQTRADALADVVRSETARREALQTRMIEDVGSAQAARADAEDAVARLEQELRELRADH
jgi:hypothetical protein